MNLWVLLLSSEYAFFVFVQKISVKILLFREIVYICILVEQQEVVSFNP